MQVEVQDKSRVYVVDVTTGRIISQTGRGPQLTNPDRIREIVSAARQNAVTRAGQGTVAGITIAPTSTPIITPAIPQGKVPALSDEQVLKVLKDRMNTFRHVADGIANGEFYAAVISGGPGMGKSETTTNVLLEAQRTKGIKYKIIQGGNVTPISLYDLLYKYRERGNVIVMDDSDTILNDEQGMMLLKAALDSKPDRRLSWLSQAPKDAPSEFVFLGSIMFLTNQNFQAQIDKGTNPTNKRIQHMAAIASRVTYVDLMMNTMRAKWLWTYEVCSKQKVLQRRGLSATEETEVLTFIHDNLDKLREVSIRLAVKIVPWVKLARRNTLVDWRREVGVTEFRNDENI